MPTCKDCLHYEPCYDYGNILDQIHGGVICDSFKPTADVVEVKHGYWREGTFLKVGGLADVYPSVICSDCGITFCDIVNNHNYMYRYCPNCGAKMDGGKAK